MTPSDDVARLARDGDAPGSVTRPLLLLALLSLFWGATFPVVRMGVAAGASAFLLVMVDLLIAAGPMALVAALARAPRGSARSFGGSALLGVVLIGGTNLFLFWGVQFATGGMAAIVFALTPILSFLVLRLLGGGRALSVGRAIALVLGLGGVFTLAYASLGSALLSNGWGAVALFLGASCQATGAVLVGRFRPHGETLFGQAAQFLGGGAVASVAVLAFGGTTALPASLPVLASIAYFVLATCVAGYTVYFHLLRTTGAVGANLVTYLNPLVALAIGVAVLGEAFGRWEVAGLALVLLALGLFGRSGRRSAGPAPEHAAPATPVVRTLAPELP